MYPEFISSDLALRSFGLTHIHMCDHPGFSGQKMPGESSACSRNLMRTSFKIFPNNYVKTASTAVPCPSEEFSPVAPDSFFGKFSEQVKTLSLKDTGQATFASLSMKSCATSSRRSSPVWKWRSNQPCTSGARVPAVGSKKNEKEKKTGRHLGSLQSPIKTRKM